MDRPHSFSRNEATQQIVKELPYYPYDLTPCMRIPTAPMLSDEDCHWPSRITKLVMGVN